MSAMPQMLMDLMAGRAKGIMRRESSLGPCRGGQVVGGGKRLFGLIWNLEQCARVRRESGFQRIASHGYDNLPAVNQHIIVTISGVARHIQCRRPAAQQSATAGPASSAITHSTCCASPLSGWVWNHHTESTGRRPGAESCGEIVIASEK